MNVTIGFQVVQLICCNLIGTFVSQLRQFNVRETLKGMHTQALNFLYADICSTDLFFFSHVHVRIHLLFSFFFQRRRPFVLFLCSLSFLSRAGVFFDLYSQLCVCVYVCRFDGAAYIQMDDDDDMTKKKYREKEEKKRRIQQQQ